LHDDGDLKLALVQFEGSYDLAPHYKVLYNIGQIALELHEWNKAKNALERYLSEGGNVAGACVSEVSDEIDAAKAKLANQPAKGLPPQACVPPAGPSSGQRFRGIDRIPPWP
jgi:hypothetical protein